MSQREKQETRRRLFFVISFCVVFTPKGNSFRGANYAENARARSFNKDQPGSSSSFHVFWAGLLKFGQLPPPWEKEAFFCPIPLLPAQKWYLFLANRFFWVRWGGDFIFGLSDSGPNMDSVRIANWIAFRPFLSGIKIVLCRTRFFLWYYKKEAFGLLRVSITFKGKRGRKEPPGYDFLLPFLEKG